MAALLGLAAAVGYGVGDFLGGWASRRVGVLPVVLWSQVVGLGVLLVVLGPLTDGAPAVAALGWGGAAGAAVACGLTVYFRGLARAPMGVVAPIAAVIAAALPVGVGLALGERPSVLELAGIAVAVGAVALVSLAPGPGDEATPLVPAGPFAPAAPPAVSQSAVSQSAVSQWGHGGPWAPGVVEAVAAGMAFGAFFAFMDRTGPGSALWPLLAANVMSLGILGVVAGVTQRRWRPAAGSWPAIAAAGTFGTAASLAFLLAVRQGLLSLTSVLAALSPAVTVALARMVTRERLAPRQLAGLAAAIAGVALIAAG